MIDCIIEGTFYVKLWFSKGTGSSRVLPRQVASHFHRSLRGCVYVMQDQDQSIQMDDEFGFDAQSLRSSSSCI